MIKRLLIFLLMATTCNAALIHDRDIYDVAERQYYRSILETMAFVIMGTVEGQLLYWDATDSQWVYADVAKLKWNDVTNVLLIDTLNLNNSLDISSYTNLVAGTNITLAGDTLNVDDAFLINDGDDTTTGTLTAGNFTTAGTATTDILIVGSNPPASITSAGIAGTITYDADWLYVAVANDSWKRVALSTWAVTDVLLLDGGVDKLLLSDGASFLLIRL